MGKQIGESAVSAVENIYNLPQVQKGLRAAPRVRHLVSGRWRLPGPIGGAGGIVLSVANVATAKNKPRALAEAAGGLVGGAIGAGLGGGIAAPVTGTVGAAAGSWAGGHLCDAVEDLLTPDEIENRRKIAETKRINDARNQAQQRG
ncbi:hypothetical protein ACO2Q0_03075 [Phenylobacterium sp. VNQ135]|uniref:hypothetical protein n=1 Tax=Phenylobacterium sp. VNQ135 TaxID=3400922 RepID=UPI003BFF4E3E